MLTLRNILMTGMTLSVLYACGDDAPGTTTDAGTPADTGTMPDMGTVADAGTNPDTGPGSDAGANPQKPTLGAIVDRNGRAGITTALVSPLASDDDKGAARDAYNMAPPAMWSSDAIVSDIQASLAVYDGLDGTCGNQLIADAGASRYAALAGALADDRIYVNMAAQSCGQYFAVELDATGVAANQDCGGRRPGDDVIDVTYSALAIGAVSGVGDGVPGDSDVDHPDTFPWLAAPRTAAPPRPNLGALVDRNGRAGITTALVSPLASEADKGAARDAYNTAPPAMWSSDAIVSDIQASLAVYDGLDGMCGNQLIADAAPSRYAALAGALVDDRLYVNMASQTCGQYFGVELAATGVAPNMDCGGRRPSDDVIDVTYSALAIGAVSGVGDGVPMDADGMPSMSFPFLAAPLGGN